MDEYMKMMTMFI